MTRAILLVIAILALWGLAAWSESGALYNGSNLPAYLRLASAILAILVTSGLISTAILEFGIRRPFKAEPVGAQRVVVFVAVTLLVSVVTMKILGYDITTILTTSALLTAIVGFALQPTLGGLFSGIALQLDSHLKPGDGIRYQGSDVKIESMNWRSVVGRRRDDTLVIIPNSSLAGEPVELYPNDRSIWNITIFTAPTSIPPQRISDLVRELVADLDFVDITEPVRVMPSKHQPEHAAIEYRVRYKVSYYFEIREVDAEVMRRIWYGYQRENIPFPVSRLYGETLRDACSDLSIFPDGSDWTTAAKSVLKTAGAAISVASIEALEEIFRNDGTTLLFGPGERLILPARFGPSSVILAAGSVNLKDRDFAERQRVGDRPQQDAMHLYLYQLSDDAQIQRATVLLANHIGPYAQTAVSDAARQCGTVAEVIDRVSREIDAPNVRQAFITEASVWIRDSTGPGLFLETHRNAAGHRISDPGYRAVDEAAIIVLNEGATKRARTILQANTAQMETV